MRAEAPRQQPFPATPRQLAARTAVCLGGALALLGVVGAVVTGVVAKRKLLAIIPGAVALSGGALALCCHRLGRQDRAQAVAPADELVGDLTPLDAKVQVLLRDTTRGLLKMIGLHETIAGAILSPQTDPQAVAPLVHRLERLRIDGSKQHREIAELLHELYSLRTHGQLERLNYLRVQLCRILHTHNGITVRVALNEAFDASVAAGEFELAVNGWVHRITGELGLPPSALWLCALPPEASVMPEDHNIRILYRESLRQLLDFVGVSPNLCDAIRNERDQRGLETLVARIQNLSDPLQRGVAATLRDMQGVGLNDFERLQWLRVQLADMLAINSFGATTGIVLDELGESDGAVQKVVCRIIRDQNLELDALFAFAQPQPKNG